MKTLLSFALALFATACFAQKWVDDKGKVYYGDPPPGVKVTRAPMKGGATSSVGSQGGGAQGGAAQPRGSGGGLTGQEAEFQKRQATRDAEQNRRDRDARVIRNNDEVMRNNERVWRERYGK